MESLADADQRLGLAEGHFLEAEEEGRIGQWRAAAASAQLCGENAGKAVLALCGPIPRTHDVHEPLRRAAALLPAGTDHDMLSRLADLVQPLGGELHSQATYGDEKARLTPWQLFPEERARALVDRARQALDLARQLVELRRRDSG